MGVPYKEAYQKNRQQNGFPFRTFVLDSIVANVLMFRQYLIDIFLKR